MSDGEAIDKMGGWIECENCCVAVSLAFSFVEKKEGRKKKFSGLETHTSTISFQAHFGCLSETQRVGILKQASLEAGERVRTIQVNQATVSLPLSFPSRLVSRNLN